jgi:hypothetical protein
MTRAADADWRLDPQLWIEAFVIANFGGLVFDIYLAHSENGFRNASEYIPLYFSAAAPLVLVAGLSARARSNALWRGAGYLTGWLAVLIGLTGVLLHLDSQFFYTRTLRSLTYAAPFAAPLAYTGLGLLLIVNRMVKSDDVEWAQWVLLLALGGFAGNFVFSLTDHAMNGFFNRAEWIPVVSSAFAVSFLLVPFLMKVTRRFLMLCAAVLGSQALVGLIGFALHLRAVYRQPGLPWFERLLSGAPPMAPLLFPNLVALGWIALWVLSGHLQHDESLARDLPDVREHRIEPVNG